MDNIIFTPQICPVTQTTDLIRGKWKPIILYLVENEINRFGLLVKRMPNVSKKVLTQQLRELESDGLLERDIQIAQPPQKVIYRLTEKGSALRRLIEQIFDWGVTYGMVNDTKKPDA